MISPTLTTAAPPIALRDLARAIGGSRVVGDGSVRVAGIRQDSRAIQPGDLFAVRAGQNTSGTHHVAEAMRRGAAALLAESGAFEGASLPVLEVDNIRLGIACASAVVYGDPTASLGVVGITGTNGKTTTSLLAGAAIEGAGGKPGMLGTLGFQFDGALREGSHTTPEVDEVTRIAAYLRSRGASHLVMEVSSHALAQARVEGVKFAVAAFTNLTQDHLDFHGDMETYGAQKRRLFVDLSPRASVINVDDPFGVAIARELGSSALRVSAEPGRLAEIVPITVASDRQRTRARVATPAGEVAIDSPLLGAHNLSNLLVALGIAHALGLDVARSATALSQPIVVPGRLERCDTPKDDVTVLVDYAHTPDALARVLRAVRPLTSGRVICVFGCGGDRDPGKRAKMGAAVAKAADLAVVTTDNPRSEDPRAIADAVLAGMIGVGRFAPGVELHRATAIERAIALATEGDVVLIAGKGHETYQEVRGVRHPFDDRVEARRALAQRRAQRGGE
jgi:UDP-N-acetylmuramoyl-L-alanyl-D-glutamate--2,6-diaminopimelate ligase